MKAIFAKTLPTILLFAISASLSSCLQANNNRAPIPGVLSDAKPQSLSLKVIVLNTDSSPAKDITVSILSLNQAQMEEAVTSAKTNSSGEAKLNLTLNPSALSTNFNFSGNGITWTESVYNLPQGLGSTTLYFTLDSLKKRVRFSGVSY